MADAPSFLKYNEALTREATEDSPGHWFILLQALGVGVGCTEAEELHSQAREPVTAAHCQVPTQLGTWRQGWGLGGGSFTQVTDPPPGS